MPSSVDRAGAKVNNNPQHIFNPSCDVAAVMLLIPLLTSNCFTMVAYEMPPHESAAASRSRLQYTTALTSHDLP